MRTPGEPMVRVGTSGWSYKSWVGVFYPDGTAPADYLRRYAEHFDTVEVDSTFYRTPTGRMVDGWAERIRRYRESGASIFAYANNRYQGHAPATVRSLVVALSSAASAGLPPA